MNTGNEATPPTLSERAQGAIDQAVVDGLVDGRDLRVHVTTLIEFAFEEGKRRLPDDMLRGFYAALAGDSRYVGRIRSEYGYRPFVGPECTAQPSLLAIIGGAALCSDLERQQALGFMEELAQLVYETGRHDEGVLTTRQVSSILDMAGRGGLTRQEYDAFSAYMARDPRFHVVGDGRIVLTELFSGDPNRLSPLPSIENIAQAVERALPYVSKGPSGIFRIGALLGTMKAQGSHVPDSQIREVYRCMLQSPAITRLGDGKYRLDRELLPRRKPI